MSTLGGAPFDPVASVGPPPKPSGTPPGAPEELGRGAGPGGATPVEPSPTSAPTMSLPRSREIGGSTSVELFLRCPRLWALLRSGWRRADDDPMARAMGSVGALVLASSRSSSLPLSDTLALVSLEALQANGWPGATDAAALLLRKALKAALATQLEGEILAVEQQIGFGHPDVVFKREDGLVVWDDKYATNMSSDKIHWRESEYQTKPQGWLYALAAEAHFEQPVVEIVYHVYTATPSPRAWPIRIPVTRARLALAEQDFTATYHQIAWTAQRLAQHPDELPAGRWTACNNRDEQYGSRCPMWEACHECALQPEKMALIFVKEPG